MNKHTPGPWKAREVEGPGFPGQIGWVIDFNDDHEQVADYVYEEADARLIAAAPDLLEALESVQMALAGYTHQNDVTRAAMTKAWAALDKARQ